MLIRLFYTLLLALVAPLLLFGLYKSKPNKPKFGRRWKEHFGITPRIKSNQRPIWIHAVSVGESIAAVPLIKELKKQNPDQTIVVTTTTSTGAEQIEKLGELVEHRYMPIDFSFAVKGFLKAVNPTHMLIIETELWPNTLHQVSKFGVPITVVNARLSEKSRNSYSKFQPVFNIIEPCLTNILCQSPSDADHFESLGVPKSKLVITGSIKFDIQISDEVREKGKALRKELGESRSVWIAASTHEGEDQIILDAHKQVLKDQPDSLLILVPRHPERFDSVVELCQSSGFTTTRRTNADIEPDKQPQVYVGDTMGEMLVLIGAADVCFMGGSLLGDKVGGHNVLEPAALGVPVITGPSYFNFKEITDELLIQGGIIVSTANDLSGHISQMIEYKEIRNTTSQVAKAFSQLNQGSLITTLNAI
ncbi:lipid IV(A) 3-deoxy-D-manno-octulosonic acid transferase [Vibrio splendidus]|uniref:lipid IV(A) 3-deoxy-D-manno-octulosonic acid transferase n=1 Tax=Vibrio splendidus TaxID=29497 RepID=UPI000C8265B1|nr:lipid IV(A) 3-deoxy-D-manno-octulosonic acid transferase [Vibrio splendidus]MCW4446375.1 lipid IV(A) 3-deoxy-D-manno-octulosonic acid transferase [Vibrio splendidus]PMG26079.1 3-deoxy-D-manno-octulosonic acid transferase [Vibrio splendidus]